MRRYAAHDWSAEPVNLLINSPTGGGKTYLACAIGIAACQPSTTSPTPAWTRGRKLVIARGDAIAHQRLLNELSDTDLLIIDDFLTVGIDPDAASDLFAILANREHRRPTVIASSPDPITGSRPCPTGSLPTRSSTAREQRPHHQPRRGRHAPAACTPGPPADTYWE